MNICTINSVKYICLLLLTMLVACGESYKPHAILSQAQEIIESDPENALVLLDSISNPENLDENNYMQYIVAHVQAKDKCFKDITKDTLIFETPHYFEERNMKYQALLAHFYSASVHLERKEHDKSMASYLQAKRHATALDNYEMVGKCYNNMGLLYRDNNMVDSAIVNYRRALHCYDKVPTAAAERRLYVYSAIGKVFNSRNQLDSAYYYFEKGLDLANESENKHFKHRFTRFLSILNRDLGNYDKASSLAHEAIILSQNATDSLNIFLNTARLYSVQHKLDSAKHYVDLVKDRLTEIEDIFMLRASYGSLAQYYKQTGDYKEALRYQELQKEVNSQIMEDNNSRKLFEVTQVHEKALHRQELDTMRMRNYLFLAVALSIILIVALLTYIRNRRMKHEHQEEVKKNKLLQAQYELVNQKLGSFVFLQDIYLNLVKKWGVIDTEVKALAAEYGATEKPTIYNEIGKLVTDIQESTNSQLIEWAKDYFKKQPAGDQILEALSDKHLLLLMLCHSGYSKKDIATVLGMNEKKIFPRKLDVRRELRKINIPEDRIEELLFSDSTDNPTDADIDQEIETES